MNVCQLAISIYSPAEVSRRNKLVGQVELGYVLTGDNIVELDLFGHHEDISVTGGRHSEDASGYLGGNGDGEGEIGDRSIAILPRINFTIMPEKV